MIVDILEAVPAAGKTAAILKHVMETDKKVVIASISRQLSRQSFEYYQSIGGMDGIIVDSDNKNEYMSVAKTLVAVMKTEPRVVFVTHSALMQYAELERFRGYNLYIDEVPDMISLQILRFTANSDHILKYCNDVGKGIGVYYPLSINDDCIDELKSIAEDGLYRNDDIAERILPAYRCLLKGHPVIFKRESDTSSSMFFIEDYTNMQWDVFESITIACANFEPTLTGYVLRNWVGWEFRDSHLKDELSILKYPNTDRVTISVMVDQNWSRYVSEKTIGGENVYGLIQDKIDTMFPSGEYIYTTNSYRSRMNGQQIQYNPHGLNMYSDETNVVALFSYNPQPWQIPILSSLANIQGVDENGLINAFLVSKYLEPVFQLCTRGDIRNIDSKKPIKLVVPDMRAAEYLKSNYLPNAAIDRTGIIEVCSERQSPKDYNWAKRGITAIVGMTEPERKAFYYLLKKTGKKSGDYDPTNPRDLLYVKDWLTSYREKKAKKKSGA
ncbi:MAG: hypothetical protein ACRC9Y_10040 [Aeromonas veronii]